MFDNPKLALSGVQKTYSIINEYLNSHKTKVYELNMNFCNTTAIHLKIQMIKDGLQIFVKTFGIEDYIKTLDSSNYNFNTRV